MGIKADIEIVTGFIWSGKTSFINALIQDNLVDNEKVIIIQCESGDTSIEQRLENDKRITIKSCDFENPLTEEFIKNILDMYCPHRIIIEFNGTWFLNELLDILQSKSLNKLCKLTTMYHITDVVTFELYLSNMESMLLPTIKLSNLILLNNTNAINKDELKDINLKIKRLNPHAHIIEAKNTGEFKKAIEDKKELKLKNKIVIAFMIIAIFFVLSGGSIQYSEIIELSVVQNFSTIFISIVLEAMPFIMLGSFISALMQEFISEQFIKRIIPKNKFLGFLGAGLIGIVFPVCECAIVPITKRLMKKGVPVGIAVTFMLAVPIVNPIVLLSTYYAFYDRPSIVLIRGGFGLLVAIVIGVLIAISEKGNPSQIKQDTYESDSTCYCGCEYDKSSAYKHSKLKNVLGHTSSELLVISKYLIFGAVISSIYQVSVSNKFTSQIGNHPYYSILAMMALAFILSICSEADAFIARSFLGQFTVGSVSAFLILGPMIDIKNTLMLSGNFKMKFVIKLILYITVISFSVGCIINLLEMMGVI